MLTKRAGRGFNSIVVRLKAKAIKSRTRTQTDGFNSIVVRLKARQPRDTQRGIQRFQFHSGSIKSKDQHPRPVLWPERFQFHSGSIKRWAKQLPLFFSQRFQFHSGSIKSIDVSEKITLSRRFQFHSGSIKRTTWQQLGLEKPWCFNSIVVRLKGEQDLIYPANTVAFQFHSGSIKRIAFVGTKCASALVSIP